MFVKCKTRERLDQTNSVNSEKKLKLCEENCKTTLFLYKLF